MQRGSRVAARLKIWDPEYVGPCLLYLGLGFPDNPLETKNGAPFIPRLLLGLKMSNIGACFVAASFVAQSDRPAAIARRACEMNLRLAVGRDSGFSRV